MSPATHLAKQEGFSGEVERRKRLGQYFSGIGLARLLAAIASAEQARTIIDPMGGIGDMLAGCLSLGARPEHIGSIEIDPIASLVCEERLPEACCLLGSAFDPAILAELPCSEWDLVITNPPYVRYQSMSKGAGEKFKLPSSEAVRKGLIDALNCMTALDDMDRTLFKAMASSYSGLADLAVPSWILSASMVAIGGRIALVVPESWLSRDYAAVVHYLLLRWFHIEYLIEDEHAVWFEGAQVKTTLLVARRIERRSDAFSWHDKDFFVRGRISGRAAGLGGPVARLFPGVQDPEVLFASQAKQVLDSGVGFDNELVSVFPTAFKRVANNLKTACSNQKWFLAVGESASGQVKVSSLPEALTAWLGSTPALCFDSLEALGVSVGQGLRTGANGFFYVTYLSDDGVEACVSTGIPGVKEVSVPIECLRPVLRRQSELSGGYVVDANTLSGRALDLRSYALLEDTLVGGESARKAYTPMQEGLASFVRQAKRTNFGTEENPKYIEELSAVAPNVRKGDPHMGIAPRFWYMLPDFASRHMPDLLVPRVNGATPKAWLVANSGTLVDANFVTLCVKGEGNVDKYALLAFLNSAWCRAIFEHGAAVMGGGALKVEATHLRRVPVPKFTEVEWCTLTNLGRSMIREGGSVEGIDYLVVSALLGRSAEEQDVASLLLLVEQGRMRRENHKKRKGAQLG